MDEIQTHRHGKNQEGVNVAYSADGQWTAAVGVWPTRPSGEGWYPIVGHPSACSRDMFVQMKDPRATTIRWMP